MSSSLFLSQSIYLMVSYSRICVEQKINSFFLIAFVLQYDQYVGMGTTLSVRLRFCEPERVGASRTDRTGSNNQFGAEFGTEPTETGSVIIKIYNSLFKIN